MKKMKFLAFAVILLMGISFTSCFNSDDTNTYDGGTFVTVSSGYLGTGLILKSDDGLTLSPTNPSFLLLKDKVSYPERAFVFYKLAEGETYVTGKTNYSVTIVGGYVVNVKEFNLRPDTLQNDYNVASMPNFWYANGYATVRVGFYYTSNSIDFDLYKQKVGNDTLYVKLNYSKGGGTNYSQSTTMEYSFKLPYVEGLQPKNDSVWVKLSVKGPDNQALEKNIHCKYDFN